MSKSGSLRANFISNLLWWNSATRDVFLSVIEEGRVLPTGINLDVSAMDASERRRIYSVLSMRPHPSLCQVL